MQIFGFGFSTDDFLHAAAFWAACCLAYAFVSAPPATAWWDVMAYRWLGLPTCQHGALCVLPSWDDASAMFAGVSKTQFVVCQSFGRGIENNLMAIINPLGGGAGGIRDFCQVIAFAGAIMMTLVLRLPILFGTVGVGYVLFSLNRFTEQ